MHARSPELKRRERSGTRRFGLKLTNTDQILIDQFEQNVDLTIRPLLRRHERTTSPTSASPLTRGS